MWSRSSTATTTGPGFCAAATIGLLYCAQSRQQAGYADRKAGRRNRLAAKARHQPVVAPAPADRAEADRLAVLARRFEGEIGLEDRAGVVFEAADDRGINLDAFEP